MSTSNDNEASKNAPYRSARREVRKRRASRQATRKLTIRSEQRETPDVRKIARAIIAMALAEAEREAQAQAEREEAADPTEESPHE